MYQEDVSNVQILKLFLGLLLAMMGILLHM